MIGRLALRSLTAHPVRSAVLAAGFGVGVAVMAILLGVAEIVLDQARAPGLVGGGDVVIRLAPQVPARLVLSGTLQSAALRDRVRVAAPSQTERLYLVHGGPYESGQGARRHPESRARAWRPRGVRGGHLARHRRRHGLDAGPAGQRAAPYRSLSPDPGCAEMGVVLGRVAVLQRPRG